jgi:predicted outer membrane lipoprotein
MAKTSKITHVHLNSSVKSWIYGVLFVLAFGIFAFLAYTNTTLFLEMRANISIYEDLHSSLDSNLDDANAELAKVEQENEQLNETISLELSKVFPKNQDYITLTQSIEKFSNELHKPKEPFYMTNLSYGKPRANEDGESYGVLPFKMTIHSTYTNFNKFLGFIENSGMLSEQTRLIAIKSININFVSFKGTDSNLSGQTEINYTIDAYSFFQNAPSK